MKLLSRCLVALTAVYALNAHSAIDPQCVAPLIDEELKVAADKLIEQGDTLGEYIQYCLRIKELERAGQDAAMLRDEATRFRSRHEAEWLPPKLRELSQRSVMTVVEFLYDPDGMPRGLSLYGNHAVDAFIESKGLAFAERGFDSLLLGGYLPDRTEPLVRSIENLPVSRLDLWYVNDAQLGKLLQNKSLTHLALREAKITDSGARLLARSHVEAATLLSPHQLTVQGFDALAMSQSIKTLSLRRTRIPESTLHWLASNQKLENLQLYSVESGDHAAEVLAKGHLRRLSIMDSSVTDVGAFALASNRTLEALVLDRNSISAAGVRALSASTNLVSLSVTDNRNLNYADQVYRGPPLWRWEPWQFFTHFQ